MNPHLPSLVPHHTPPYPTSGPSPTKRPRLSPPPTTLAQPPPPPPPQPLQPLPLPLLLLTLAQSYHAHSLSFHPTLTKRPISTNAHKRWTIAQVQGARLKAACIACLREVVEMTGQGGQYEGFGAGRIEVRARVLLSECLSAGAGEAMGGGGELDKVLSKGHDSLKPFTPHLALLQPTLHSSSTQTSKFARQTLRRLLSSATLPVHWTYHLHMTLASLPNTSYVEALSSWTHVERVAAFRADHVLVLVCSISIARLSLAKGGEWDRVAEMLDKLRHAPEHVLQGLPTSLTVYALLIESLYDAHMGLIKEAKEKLKTAHGLLDRPREEGEEKRSEDEGWCKIPINPPDPRARHHPSDLRIPPPCLGAPLPCITSVSLTLAPRSLVYNFAFLASVAVHRDPFGSKPRSTLFANEGLKLFDHKLVGSEPSPPLVTPEDAGSYFARVAGMKIHLLLFSAELEMMRSSFQEAHRQLLDAITTARTTTGLWDEFADRITLDLGMLAHAQGDEVRAEECFETVLARTVGGNSRDGTRIEEGEEDAEQLKVLAGVSLLMLKMSQGMRVRLSTTSLTGSTGSPQRPTLNPSSSAFESPRLDSLAREIISIVSNPSSAPSSKLLGEFLQALTRGEITKAKQHLSVALQLSNQMNSNHAKALCLSLLANLFLMTRNDQAQKMLHAASHLARGMGARPPPPSSSTANIPGSAPSSDDLVGNARLGLWLGERLLESYKKDNDPIKVAEQERRNDAHRRAVMQGL